MGRDGGVERERGRGRRRTAVLAVVALLVAGLGLTLPARAEDPVPYDDHLGRLAEILGSLHHLRPLCGADEPQVWRDQMSALIAAEQPSPDRARRLTDRFNRAYRALAATHRTCTDEDRQLAERYMAEGAALAREVVVRWGRP